MISTFRRHQTLHKKKKKKKEEERVQAGNMTGATEAEQHDRVVSAVKPARAMWYHLLGQISLNLFYLLSKCITVFLD